MIIITGCQRSGTMSIADALGLDHEVKFHPGLNRENFHSIFSATKSEASWMAAPFAKPLLLQGFKIIHLIRHPLKVINSLEGIEFWRAEHEGHKPYRDFISQHLEIPENLNPITQSCMYWYEWNHRLSLLNLPRIKIEDWENIPQLNQRKKAQIINWGHVPDSEWKNRCQELATEYNYI